MTTCLERPPFWGPKSGRCRQVWLYPYVEFRAKQKSFLDLIVRGKFGDPKLVNFLNFEMSTVLKLPMRIDQWM